MRKECQPYHTECWLKRNRYGKNWQFWSAWKGGEGESECLHNTHYVYRALENWRGSKWYTPMTTYMIFVPPLRVFTELMMETQINYGFWKLLIKFSATSLISSRPLTYTHFHDFFKYSYISRTSSVCIHVHAQANKRENAYNVEI